MELTQEQINQYKQDGVIIIENVLTPDEIKYYRDCY